MHSFSVKALLALVAVFAPIQGVIGTTLALLLVDLATGVWAAYKRKEPITSAGFQRTIVKLAVYEGAICLAYLVQHYMLMDMMPITSIASGYIGLTELTSCYENIDGIAGGNLLRQILDKLKSKNAEMYDKK